MRPPECYAANSKEPRYIMQTRVKSSTYTCLCGSSIARVVIPVVTGLFGRKTGCSTRLKPIVNLAGFDREDATNRIINPFGARSPYTLCKRRDRRVQLQ